MINHNAYSPGKKLTKKDSLHKLKNQMSSMSLKAFNFKSHDENSESSLNKKKLN